MKLYKLNIHPKTFNVNDLLLNAKDHPDVKLYDIVEIYHPEDEGFRLLLQVTNLTDDQREKGRDIISVESNIAATFNLRNYADVIMHLVNPASVALDSVEITFKDQYMGRYEMWRLKTNLTNTCVYLNKKIEFPESSLRCQVYEMWSQGERVACGVINEDTKIVFRSSTSMVYLFIQMSSEMWDFDIHGDLYFEKAVNGFLSDLFTKWKKLGSNPEVTIVLFSRTFYSAKSLDEFPLYMRECLQMDYKGRFYEDFYRVAIQNERNDDWSTILVQLRRLFTAYQNTVLRYHERANFAIPQASNSTAAQGNFLEVLNISLNVFEKHYLDRSFDRTGQLSVVITPGVGVFEVDRELTNITKQRIIDNGVGSDLVCVGEQPLHAVPLLKFHNKTSSLSAADDYSMPHWINLSFYSTNKKVAYSTFIPRIKLPPLVSQQHCSLEDNKENQKLKFSSDNQTEYIHNSLFDYDAYDAQIFTIPPAHGTCSLQRAPRTKKTSVPSLDAAFICRELEALSPPKQAMRRKMSDPDIHHGTSNVLANLSHNGSPISDSTSAIEKQAKKSIINSPGPIIRAGRALINPFDPSHVTIKLTSNRRRWTHIFPKGPTGVLIQQHHYQAVPAKNGAKCYSRMLESTGSSSDFVHTSTCTAAKSESVHSDNGSDGTLSRRKISTLHSAAGPLATVESSKSLTLLWGATGEQEWTPALTTAGKIIIGVDWKSLTIPACLPITTDYFPDKRSLYNDYLVSDYTLLPEDVNADYAQKRAVYRKPLTTEQVFKELISQRLAQGFQWIVLPDKAPCCGGSLQFQAKQPSLSVIKMLPPQEATKEYLLSVGRIFHKISLIGSVITVTRYRPRHPCKPINVDYRYRFHAPQHDTYEVSGVNFTTEKLENFSWNYMDQYICTRGDTDYPLMESLKYWRFRMYLLPKEHPAMKKILDGQSNRCDIFTEISPDSCKQNADEFLRFVETHINKIKRPAMNCNKSKAARGSPATVTQHQQQLQQQQPQSHLTRRRHSTSILSRPPPNQNNHISNSPFRERVGSNRLPEKRPRSGSKVIEKGPGRVSPASEAVLNNESVSMDYGSDEAFVTETKLKSNASLLEIYEAMKHPETGVGFLAPTQGTPSCTFASYDAVSWLMARVENCSDPVHILETMRKEKLICHASGTFSKPIIVGFYLYFIVQQDKTSKEYMPPLCDLESFENEWMEVEIVNPDACITDIRERVVPRFLRNNVELQVKDGPIYKQAHLEIGMKGDRIEWGHKRYHDKMTPGHAFELVVQWLTASGSNVHDVVYGWQRKAQQCQFQLIAIPADPLAAPFTEKSDPLRGPIFIPLDIECIKQHRTFLFEEFSEDTWADRMLLFQEAIVERFGFMPCRVETKTGSNQVSFNNQYVHCSANMFILVASPHEEVKGKQRETPTGRSFTAHSYESKYLESYITRHVGKKNEAAADAVKRLGFLWSWNHMIPNKKWKSLMINNSPDNELFQLKMLRDFKDFCSNQSNRLVNFWEQCWKTKEKMSSNSD